jgi:hypothetical protein
VDIRGSSTWKKVLETEEYAGKIESIVDEIKRITENFCVSRPQFIGMSRVATAEANLPSDRLVTSYRKGYERYSEATICESHDPVAIMMHRTHHILGHSLEHMETGSIRPVQE